jgi:hypothetical protein
LDRRKKIPTDERKFVTDEKDVVTEENTAFFLVSADRYVYNLIPVARTAESEERAVKIKFRLADVLAEYKLNRHGYKKDIARDMGYGQRKFSGLLSGRPVNLRFEKLERLITLLVKRGVPPDKLPGILFGRDDLWDRVRQAARVEIVLGGTMVAWANDSTTEMVAARDLEVAAKIVQELTLRSHRSIDLAFTIVRIQYSATGDVPAEYREHASELFADMRNRQGQDPPKPSVTFYVASQRKNSLTELLVASCFGCEPFRPFPSGHRVPFYLMYRDGVPNLPSCFGGRAPPKVAGASPGPGIYYRKETGWQFLPHKDSTADAGIVFITFQENTEAMEVALFGFSSAATLAVGRHFLKKTDVFWPPAATLAGRQVGAYICRMNWPNGSTEADCEVIPLSKKILESHLARPSAAIRAVSHV